MRITKNENTYKKNIFLKIRWYFFTCLAITAPLGITIYLSFIFINFVDSKVKNLVPEKYNPDNYLPFDIPGTGLVVAIFSLIVIGFFTAGIFGRFFVNIGENLINKLPIIRSIYNALKQIFQTILGSSSKAFREVVVIGHSEGALIGMIASQSIADRFISVAGAGEDYLTLIERQLSIQPPFVRSMSEPIIEKLKNKKLVDSVPPLLNSLFRSDVQSYLIDASSFDPVEEISKLNMPILIIQGSTDIQIDISDALILHKAAKNSRLEIIEGMNHVFRQASDNRLLNLQTYGNP